MTHHKEDKLLLSILQEAITEKGLDLKKMLQGTIQDILKEEMKSFLKAEVYERSETRKGYRNGYKPRMLKTRVGTIELMVPKDRDGLFQTELFDRYQRSEKALFLSIAEMYVNGVSTRKVSKITEALCGISISRSQVSVLTSKMDKEIEKWRQRKISGKYPYLIVDARYEKVRIESSVVSQGALIVIGINKQGYREVLGVWTADTESEHTWTEVFKELKDRGLTGIKYIVSDEHKGLIKAVKRNFQSVIWQRCQVHFTRNILCRVSKKDRYKVLQLMREITNASTLESGRNRLKEAVGLLQRINLKAAEYLDENCEDILSVYSLPEPHRRRLRSTNMLERLNQEIKRRTRVIRIFPNERSCLRLISALAIETNDEWTSRKYLNMDIEKSIELMTNNKVA